LAPSSNRPALKKYGGQPPGLGLELTEAQHAGLDRELHEVLREGVGGRGRAHPGILFCSVLFRLNLNGIRSAATKGFEAWAEGMAADCMGVQEIKAQADTVVGRFEQVGG